MSEAIIFDLDGTLIDSVPDVCASLNFAFHQAVGLDVTRQMDVETVKTMVGKGAKHMVAQAFSYLSINPAPEDSERALTLFLERYSDHPCEKTRIYPGVVSVLDQLSSSGKKMAICTNKPLKTTVPVLAALDLEKYFQVVLCGDQVKRQKPDKFHLQLTLDQLNTSAKSSVLVGDSDNDILGARNAGIKSIAVSYGYSCHPVAQLGADYIIDNFWELPETLLKLDRKESGPSPN